MTGSEQYTEDSIRDALNYVPADNRDVWVKVGFAIESELGLAGFGVWDEWSRSIHQVQRSICPCPCGSRSSRGQSVSEHCLTWLGIAGLHPNLPRS